MGGGASRTMKVCGATESIFINSNLIISVVIDMRQCISRRKILHKMNEVCGAISHKMDKLLRKHQVDGTQLLIYSYIHVYIFAIPSSE